MDSKVAPKSQPTKLKVIFGIGIFFDVVNGFGETKGVAPIPTFAFVKVIAFLGGVVDQTLFDMIVKDEHANLVVDSGMQERILFPVQLKPIDVLVAITPNLATTMEDLGVDVRVEETKATIMEE